MIDPLFGIPTEVSVEETVADLKEKVASALETADLHAVAIYPQKSVSQ